MLNNSLKIVSPKILFFTYQISRDKATSSAGKIQERTSTPPTAPPTPPLHHWLMCKLTQVDRGNLVTFIKHLNTDPFDSALPLLKLTSYRYPHTQQYEDVSFHCSIVCSWKGPECLPVERVTELCMSMHWNVYVAIKKTNY